MADERQILWELTRHASSHQAEGQPEPQCTDASTETASIVEAARQEARRIVDASRREAAALQAQGREALRQAARDTIEALREQLQERLRRIAAAAVSDTLHGEMIAAILEIAIKAYIAKGGKLTKLEILVSEKDCWTVERVFLSRLASDLRRNTTLAPRPDITGGCKIGFNGGELVYDVTDAALTDTLCAFLTPKLADLLKA